MSEAGTVHLASPAELEGIQDTRSRRARAWMQRRRRAEEKDRAKQRRARAGAAQRSESLGWSGLGWEQRRFQGSAPAHAALPRGAAWIPRRLSSLLALGHAESLILFHPRPRPVALFLPFLFHPHPPFPISVCIPAIPHPYSTSWFSPLPSFFLYLPCCSITLSSIPPPTPSHPSSCFCAFG